MEIPIYSLIRAGQADTTDALRQYADRRLSFALRRFQQRIRRVTVRLVDVNGPRRGVDSRCSITVDLADGRQLFVDATAAWPFAAITHAANRLSETVRRDHDRHAPVRSRSRAAAAADIRPQTSAASSGGAASLVGRPARRGAR